MWTLAEGRSSMAAAEDDPTAFAGVEIYPFVTVYTKTYADSVATRR